MENNSGQRRAQAVTTEDDYRKAYTVNLGKRIGVAPDNVYHIKSELIERSRMALRPVMVCQLFSVFYMHYSQTKRCRSGAREALAQKSTLRIAWARKPTL
eukprot:6355295-Pyramimonas_sp.AAC.1